MKYEYLRSYECRVLVRKGNYDVKCSTGRRNFRIGNRQTRSVVFILKCVKKTARQNYYKMTLSIAGIIVIVAAGATLKPRTPRFITSLAQCGQR